jgi:microcin C transport system substrate-binding protein
VRTVDTAQYRRRLDDYDFDVTVANWPESLSPGNEQRDFWTSAFADKPGSQNLLGIKSPVIDELVEGVIAAKDREDLVNHVRALDRVLQWGHWVVEHWHIPFDRVAYWDKFGRPAVTPPQGVQPDTWWIDPAKADATAKRKAK